VAPSSFDNFFKKVKAVTKQAADMTAKQAKIAKLRMNVMTLQTEKGRFLQTMGIRLQSMYSQTGTINAASLLEQVKGELGNIERINQSLAEIEENIAELQSKEAELEVKDVTQDPNSSQPKK